MNLHNGCCPVPTSPVHTTESKEPRWILSIEVLPNDKIFRISVNPNRPFSTILEAIAFRMSRAGASVNPSELVVSFH